MHLEIKSILTMLAASFLTATFMQNLSAFWEHEAVWILFVLSGMLITFLKDSLDDSKKVTTKKILWTVIVIVVLCGLLRFYSLDNSLSKFWFYFWTVSIGVFAPSAVYKILQNSDEKAENGFARIVNAFVEGLIFKINKIFGNDHHSDEPKNKEDGQ